MKKRKCGPISKDLYLLFICYIRSGREPSIKELQDAKFKAADTVQQYQWKEMFNDDSQDTKSQEMISQECSVAETDGVPKSVTSNKKLSEKRPERTKYCRSKILTYFKNWAKKMELNEDGKLIIAAIGKLIVPAEELEDIILRVHGRGICHGRNHLSLTSTAIEYARHYVLDTRYFGCGKEKLKKIVAECREPDCRVKSFKTMMASKASKKNNIKVKTKSLAEKVKDDGSLMTKFKVSTEESCTHTITSDSQTLMVNQMDLPDDEISRSSGALIIDHVGCDDEVIMISPEDSQTEIQACTSANQNAIDTCLNPVTEKILAFNMLNLESQSKDSCDEDETTKFQIANTTDVPYLENKYVFKENTSPDCKIMSVTSRYGRSISTDTTHEPTKDCGLLVDRYKTQLNQNSDPILINYELNNNLYKGKSVPDCEIVNVTDNYSYVEDILFDNAAVEKQRSVAPEMAEIKFNIGLNQFNPARSSIFHDVSVPPKLANKIAPIDANPVDVNIYGELQQSAGMESCHNKPIVIVPRSVDTVGFVEMENRSVTKKDAKKASRKKGKPNQQQETSKKRKNKAEGNKSKKIKVKNNNVGNNYFSSEISCKETTEKSDNVVTTGQIIHTIKPGSQNATTSYLIIPFNSNAQTGNVFVNAMDISESATPHFHFKQLVPNTTSKISIPPPEVSVKPLEIKFMINPGDVKSNKQPRRNIDQGTEIKSPGNIDGPTVIYSSSSSSLCDVEDLGLMKSGISGENSTVGSVAKTSSELKCDSDPLKNVDLGRKGEKEITSRKSLLIEHPLDVYMKVLKVIGSMKPELKKSVLGSEVPAISRLNLKIDLTKDLLQQCKTGLRVLRGEEKYSEFLVKD